MRKKVEEKKEFNLEEAFALWKQTGKNGEYLKGKTTSECGDTDIWGIYTPSECGDTEIWGFYAKEKKNEKQPDLTICKKLDNGKMEEIAVLWETDNKTGTGKHLYGRTSEKENIIAFYSDGTNNRPYIKAYFQE